VTSCHPWGKFFIHPKSKMAATKPETAITRPIYHLAMKSQRLYLCCLGRPTRWNTFRHGFYYPYTRNQDGGYQTGNSYNSANIPPRNEISAAIPMFSGADYTLEYLSTRISLPFYQKPRWRLPHRKRL